MKMKQNVENEIKWNETNVEYETKPDLRFSMVRNLIRTSLSNVETMMK